jgi:hypothetical protein
VARGRAGSGCVGTGGGGVYQTHSWRTVEAKGEEGVDGCLGEWKVGRSIGRLCGDVREGDESLTNSSKHNTKPKKMRLPIEAGLERRERQSMEGRCQDTAMRLAVNILTNHAAACNVYSIIVFAKGPPRRKRSSQCIVLYPAHVLFCPAVLLFETMHRWAARLSRVLTGGRKPEVRERGSSSPVMLNCPWRLARGG